MPYIGYNVTNAGSFALIDDIASTFNGSNTAFTLQVGGVNITPNVQNLLIAIDGVVQQAPDAYSVSGSTITFTGAPASGADFYGVLMGQSSYVENNSITADELAISGDGSSGQLLSSDGDGTFSYVNQSAVTADANVLSGTTLKSTVVNSSLTSVGTIGTGVWQGTKVASAYLDDDTAHLSGSTFTGNLIVDKSISAGDLNTAPIVTFKNSQGSGHYTAIKFEGADGSGANTGFLGYMSHNTSSTRRFVFSHDGTTRNVAFNGDGSVIFKGSGDSLTLESTNSGTGGAQLNLNHVGGSQADGDSVGRVLFNGQDSNDNAVTYARIDGIAEDVTDGSENGALNFDTRTSNNAFSTKMRITSDGEIQYRTTGDDHYSSQVEYEGNDDIKLHFGPNYSFESGFRKVLTLDNQRVGIGQVSPTNSPLEVNVTPTNGTAGSSAFVHIGNGSVNTDGYISGLSLGWRENNANYRKTAIAVRARGDGAVRHDMCFLVDTANDQASATLQDSKLTIDGLTGNANFSNDIMRFHNDYISRVYSGYTTGNAGFSVTFPIQDNSSLLITAIFTHYGAGIATYGCARMAWLSCRDNSQDPQDISNITSSNGGSWSISTSSSVVTVSKVAGSYSGGGHYWVKIEGSANI